MEVFVTDAAGNALNGVSVEFRRAGALTNGATGPTTIVANTVGSILVGDTVKAGLAGASDSVAAITNETTFTASGAGWGGLADGVLMSITAPFPAVYNAEDATEALTQPGLTTDADGFKEAYAENGMYDIHITGGGATEEIRHNVPCVGGTTTKIYVVGSGTAEHYIRDTGRALTAGDKHTVWSALGTEIMSLSDAGGLVLTGVGASSFGGTVTMDIATITTGPLTLTAGNMVVTAGDIVMGAAVSQLVPGATSFAIRDTADAVDNLLVEDDGDVTVAQDLTHRRTLASGGTNLVALTDWTFSAGWGSTVTPSFFRATNPKDMRGHLQIIPTGAGIASNPTATLTFKDGAFPEAPGAVVMRSDNQSPSTGYFGISVVSATELVVQFFGLPVSGNQYVLDYIVMG